MKAIEAISGYLFDELLPEVNSSEAPTKKDLERGFRDYMVGKGVSSPTAEENSIKWKPQLLCRLDKRLEEWELGGLPSPAARSFDQEGLLLTWRHSKYKELTGRSGLTAEFFNVFDWLKGLRESDFLFVCVCLLKVMGAEKIFVTDGSGDHGVDCIGRIDQGPFHSIVIYVQSKTISSSNKLISRNLLLSEYGKYLAMPHSKTYEKYRRALGLDSVVDGTSYCYLVASNGFFHPSGQEISSKIGILLRSIHQITYWIYQVTTLQELQDHFGSIQSKLKRDLDYNIAKDLSFLSKI